MSSRESQTYSACVQALHYPSRPLFCDHLFVACWQLVHSVEQLLPAWTVKTNQKLHPERKAHSKGKSLSKGDGRQPPYRTHRYVQGKGITVRGRVRLLMVAPSHSAPSPPCTWPLLCPHVQHTRGKLLMGSYWRRTYLSSLPRRTPLKKAKLISQASECTARRQSHSSLGMPSPAWRHATN